MIWLDILIVLVAIVIAIPLIVPILQLLCIYAVIIGAAIVFSIPVLAFGYLIEKYFW